MTLMFKSPVQNVMIYGAETWTLGRDQANELLIKDVDFWRRETRKLRKKKIMKQKIRKIIIFQHYIIDDCDGLDI